MKEQTSQGIPQEEEPRINISAVDPRVYSEITVRVLLQIGSRFCAISGSLDNTSLPGPLLFLSCSVEIPLEYRV